MSIVVPVLALAGALLGGYLTQLTGGWVAERREDRRLLREARVALERWVATRTGPMGLAYPGISAEDMAPIQKRSLEEFFARHFQATFDSSLVQCDDSTRAERRTKLTQRETKALLVDAHAR